MKIMKMSTYFHPLGVLTFECLKSFGTSIEMKNTKFLAWNYCFPAVFKNEDLEILLNFLTWGTAEWESAVYEATTFNRLLPA